MPTGTRGDYEVGYGKPPRNAGFKKGQSGNPRGRPPGSKNLTTLLNEALNEPVTITENGRRRKITKREAVIKQLVNKSPSSDARSLKILLDLMLNLEARARSSAARRRPGRRGGPGPAQGEAPGAGTAPGRRQAQAAQDAPPPTSRWVPRIDYGDCVSTRRGPSPQAPPRPAID